MFGIAVEEAEEWVVRCEAGEGAGVTGEETPLSCAPASKPVSSKQDEGEDADSWILSLIPDRRVSPLFAQKSFADPRRPTAAEPTEHLTADASTIPQNLNTLLNLFIINFAQTLYLCTTVSSAPPSTRSQTL